MDYNSWTADLHARGYSTTGLGKNEANFSDYANSLSDEIKAKVAQNAQTQADKELQAFVASLYGKKSVMQTSDLINLCRSKGLTVKTSYVKTTYIMDEKNSSSPGKGTKKVRTGSIQMLEISDGKGGKFVIADSNGNAAIEMEELFLNEVLSGVTSDISASTIDGGQSDFITAKNAEMEAEKQLKEQQIALIKEQNEALAKQIGDLEVQARTEMEEAAAEIERINEEVEQETERIRQKWINLYETNPDAYTKEEIDSKISSEVGMFCDSANARIAFEESKLNNNQYLAQIDTLINQAGSLETQISSLNTELQTIATELNPNSQPALNADGYAMQQGFGTEGMTSAQQYNAMLTSLRQSNAYVQQNALISQQEIMIDSIQAEMMAQIQSSTIEATNDAKIELEERIEQERLEQERREQERLEQERLEKERLEQEEAERQAA